MPGKSREQRMLEQNNFLIKSKIIAQGAEIDESPEMPVELENQFLAGVLEVEAAPRKPAWRIIGITPEDFPHSSSLSPKQIEDKFIFLVKKMQKRGFVYDLAHNLPVEIAYDFLTQEFFHYPVHTLENGWQIFVDGCDGQCPDCFQARYCQTREN